MKTKKPQASKLLVDDEKFIPKYPGSKSGLSTQDTQSTLLDGIDTDGLTKQQKKKLKKKIRKEK